MTLRPLVSTSGQSDGVSGQYICPSSRRTCHTKCGAFHAADTCGTSSTGSDLAASYSARVCLLPVSGLRVSIRSRTLLRRWTISESCGTTSLKFVHSSPSAMFLSRQISSALRIRSNLRRRLRDRGEDGVLGEGQLVERLAEVALGRGLHAVALVAVEVLVEVGGDDRLLARLARERLGQPDRLDDLARLALVGRALERRGRQQPGPDELLGDGRGAARACPRSCRGRPTRCRPDRSPG